MEEKKAKIIRICRNDILELKKASRKDKHIELLKLSMLYLSDSEEQRQDFEFRPHGTLHKLYDKAGWMSKILYSPKIVLLSEKISAELPKGSIFGVGKMEKIRIFVDFAAFW